LNLDADNAPGRAELEIAPRRGRFGPAVARWAATFAMGSWVVMGLVPLLVVICALR